jgi:hypothetical protein
MNRNTRKALTVAGALLFLGVAACTETAVEPSSTISDATFFTDAKSYEAFLAKIYGGLALSGQQGPSGKPDISGIDEGFSQYLRLYWEHQELPTDEAILGFLNDAGIPDMNQDTWSSSSQMVVAMYYRIYFQVGLVNEFLRQTTDAKLAERGVSASLNTKIQEFRAEARFLRALSYWHGIDLFGDIPLVTENDEIGTTPPLQATRTEVYNYVVSELTAIRNQLPVAGIAGYGRATNAAADMLLAHVYLNAEVYTGTPNYPGALAAASAAIAGPFSLDDNYQDIFLADNNTSPEIIFPIRQDGEHTQTWGGTTFLVHASCGGSMSNTDSGVDFCWWGLRLKPEAYNRSAADPRGAAFFTTGQVAAVTDPGNFNNGIANPKFKNVTTAGVQGSNSTHVDTDFPMFRLADAYLIYAEAHLRGGGGSATDALNYVNALRERAYGDTSGNITAPELTLPFILDERGRELLWEAHRRVDLIRFGLFTGSTYIWAWKAGTLAGGNLDAHFALFPLPFNELIANPNLEQNPGY